MTASPGLVVVTGASTGIGRATVEHLARAGCHVLAGVRTEAAAEAVAADGVEPVRIDIADPDQIAALARRVADDPEGRPLRVGPDGQWSPALVIAGVNR